jgi:hypothetical protein
MKFRKSLFAVAAALTLVMTLLQVSRAEAAVRVFVGRPFVRFSYGPGYYPYYYSYWPQPYYAAAPRVGEVKISTHLKDASIYVDGGYAGLSGKLKEFHLQPGNHEIQVRDSGGNTLFQNKVQVLAGKTLEIRL